jgi:hypothetical protein
VTLFQVRMLSSGAILRAVALPHYQLGWRAAQFELGGHFARAELFQADGVVRPAVGIARST